MKEIRGKEGIRIRWYRVLDYSQVLCYNKSNLMRHTAEERSSKSLVWQEREGLVRLPEMW